MTRQISSLASNKIFSIFSLKISTCPKAGEDIEEKVWFLFYWHGLFRAISQNAHSLSCH